MRPKVEEIKSMPKTRTQKEETVADLTDKLKRAKSVVFADYQQAGTSGSKGLSMSQLSDLRSKLREQYAEFSVTKNTLLKLALDTSSLQPLTSNLLNGPTATLFSYEDEVSPIKILVKALKDAGLGSIKAGLLDGILMDSIQINRLAALPSKDELRAKVVGSLGAPLYGIVGVLQGNLRNLVYALDQIRTMKSSQLG